MHTPTFRGYPILSVITVGSLIYYITRSFDVELRPSALVHLREQACHIRPKDSGLAASSLEDDTTRSCEVCLINPDSPLCYVSRKTIKSSQAVIGSGTRVRRLLEKAERGENVRIGVIGASVTRGQGLDYGQKTFAHAFFEDFKSMYPRSELFVGAVAATNS